MRMRHAARLVLFAALLFAASCGPSAMDGEPLPAPVAETREPTGPVVATVDGVPITVAEVEDVVRRTGLGPREALTRLEEEVVLSRAAAASEGALLEDPEVEAVARRAAVQALIAREIEGRIRAETLDPEEVRARLAHDAPMFAQPERRASISILARPDRDAPPEAEAACERFARRVAAELASEADPAAAAQRYADENDPARTFGVVVENVPAARLRGDVAEPYADALFAMPAPGLVAEPVHTRFGWHVVILTEIVPAWEMPLEEAEAVVRRQMVAEARAVALEALEERLLAEHPPILDEAGVALAMEPETAEGP